MAQVFIMGPKQLARIEQLRQFGEANPGNMTHYAQRVANGQPPLPEENTLVLEPGLRLCYSLDENGICDIRHLSVSYQEKLPSVEIVEELLKLFQFRNELSDCLVYIEQGYAINVIEPQDGGLFPGNLRELMQIVSQEFYQNLPSDN